MGKSYIVREFAQREYKSYILIDFFKVGDDIKDLFKNYKDNLDMLFTYLSTYFSTRLYPRESIIVFDEIEFCPAARASTCLSAVCPKPYCNTRTPARSKMLTA